MTSIDAAPSVSVVWTWRSARIEARHSGWSAIVRRASARLVHPRRDGGGSGTSGGCSSHSPMRLAIHGPTVRSSVNARP
jgi:hypothetical protein